METVLTTIKEERTVEENAYSFCAMNAQRPRASDLIRAHYYLHNVMVRPFKGSLWKKNCFPLDLPTTIVIGRKGEEA